MSSGACPNTPITPKKFQQTLTERTTFLKSETEVFRTDRKLTTTTSTSNQTAARRNITFSERNSANKQTYLRKQIGSKKDIYPKPCTTEKNSYSNIQGTTPLAHKRICTLRPEINLLHQTSLNPYGAYPKNGIEPGAGAGHVATADNPSPFATAVS